MNPVKQYDPREDPVLKDFIERLKRELGEHLEGAILFGSRARGDADEDSDYDVLVLMDESNRDIERQINNVAHEMFDDHDVFLCAFVYSKSEYDRRTFAPLFINVRKEGLRLYG